MTFDDPASRPRLYEQGITSRPDWEAVLTPVLEALLRRPDVDPQRVCVIGVGQGGYWVARALCFEHRFAAAVLDPGVHARRPRQRSLTSGSSALAGGAAAGRPEPTPRQSSRT
jgi:predicted esterase YcpF (UPF0227 family)